MTMDPILVVDDEEDLRVLLRDSLRQSGFEVEDAPDALQALALMDSKHYAVVLTDLNMPGGPTGFDLIKAVKARDPLTLCVVITGYASMETAIQAVKFGAYDFVKKPFKLAEIEAVLNRALTHAIALSQLEQYQKDLETRVMARLKEINDLQEEVFQLNDFLLASQDELEEAPVLQPFLTYFASRFASLGYSVLVPNGTDGWTGVIQEGLASWSELEPLLPAPSLLKAPMEWGGEEGQIEGFLVPLNRGDCLLAALYLRFPWRHSFQLEDRAFLFWCRQVEAALHGLNRTRAWVDKLRRLAP